MSECTCMLVYMCVHVYICISVCEISNICIQMIEQYGVDFFTTSITLCELQKRVVRSVKAIRTRNAVNAKWKVILPCMCTLAQ